MDGGPCLKQDSQDLQDDIPRDRSVKNEIRPFTVARGPVPRERSGKPKTIRNPSPRRFLSRPLLGEGQALALREGKAFFFPVARGPVPRDRSVKNEAALSP